MRIFLVLSNLLAVFLVAGSSWPGKDSNCPWGWVPQHRVLSQPGNLNSKDLEKATNLKTTRWLEENKTIPCRILMSRSRIERDRWAVLPCCPRRDADLKLKIPSRTGESVCIQCGCGDAEKYGFADAHRAQPGLPQCLCFTTSLTSRSAVCYVVEFPSWDNHKHLDVSSDSLVRTSEGWDELNDLHSVLVRFAMYTGFSTSTAKFRKRSGKNLWEFGKKATWPIGRRHLSFEAQASRRHGVNGTQARISESLFGDLQRQDEQAGKLVEDQSQERLLGHPDRDHMLRLGLKRVSNFEPFTFLDQQWAPKYFSPMPMQGSRYSL
ncbi:hypothetical protein C8R46DRAFT_1032956 [Mycena filopes]|nr:hypothetical protein C8R46DRAFT_1032956 [Mycena filopes]